MSYGRIKVDDALSLFYDLLPWQQEEFLRKANCDYRTLSDEEIIRMYGIDPVEHVDVGDVVGRYRNEILTRWFTTQELWDGIEDTYNAGANISVNQIIGFLEDKVTNFPDTFTWDDIGKLEDFIAFARDKKTGKKP